MTRQPALEQASPGARRDWIPGRFWAWTSAITTCVALLGLVDYTTTYFYGKVTLFQTFLETFWHDLTLQLFGLFSATPKESLAGEATSSEWTYCGLVPFIVAWIVWRLWPQLKAAPVRGESAGYWILGGGLLVYTLGFLMENIYLGMLSMEIVYAGLIVTFLGWALMRLLFFPWAFLMFMWPYDFLEDFALKLRLLMSFLSHHTLELLGVANILQGTAIYSPPGVPAPFAIDVADPCSGIRSFFALITIAAVYGFITLEKIWQQAVLMALVVPMVILGNLVRLVLLVIATIQFGEGFAVGTNAEPSWFHEGAGYLVYLINLGGLVLASSWLARFTGATPSPRRTA
jgi:exosortase